MPQARFWSADIQGARGLGDIRGYKIDSDWYRAADLIDETPVYDVNEFKTNVDPQILGALRHDRNSGWRITGAIQVSQMVTLQASHQGATLHMYEGITMQEINHRSESFKSALSEVVMKQSGKSNMLLPPAPSRILYNFFLPEQAIKKRMKMRAVVTQALYAERRVSFTAISKCATISMDMAQLAGAALPGAGAVVSAIAITPAATISITVQTTDVSRSESQVGISGTSLNLVAYALQGFNCRRGGECWEVENIEHSFLKPPSAQVSPLDSIWS